MKTPSIVHVSWIDSCSPSRKWQDRDGIKGYKPASCITVGYLIEKRKDAVVIAASWGEHEVGDVTAIPRSCVKKIRRLR